jgi:hypothetical protein
MSGKKQIAKTTEQLLGALEDHLSTLAPMLGGLQKGDAAHVKDIAAKLRLLICGSSGQKGLLWELVQATGASDLIEVRYGGQIDPTKPLVQKLRFMDNHRLANAPGTPFLLESESLQKHIAEHEAAFVDGVSFTYHQLIKEMAEHSGTAHETPGVSRSMAKANAVRIGDAHPFIPILDRAARWTLTVSENVIQHAVSQGMKRVRPQAIPPPEIRLESIRFPYPMVGPVIDSEGAEGSVLVRLSAVDFVHAKEQRSTVTFPPVSFGTITVTCQATRQGRLRVTATGLAIPNFAYEGSFRSDPSGYVSVGLTWRGPDVRVFVNGEQVSGAPESVTS